MSCLKGARAKWANDLSRRTDEEIMTWMRTNDSASVSRKKRGGEGPVQRAWRRMLKQEMHKRGLGGVDGPEP